MGENTKAKRKKVLLVVGYLQGKDFYAHKTGAKKLEIRTAQIAEIDLRQCLPVLVYHRPCVACQANTTS